uniref:Major facilitator superfamily (MFS) profile domain-containing protein n=1 Tax=Setaria digitata TaxID=48799 RepID=A0A915Q8B4_9BILA
MIRILLKCSRMSTCTDTPNLDARKTPWKSMWICNAVCFMTGVQLSIFFTSMWPYLNELDSTADLDFFGWTIASYSIGTTISTSLFGFWNQKAMSTKQPASFGNLMMALGNLLYGLLPSINGANKWLMLLARFVVGLGSGHLCVLRTYAATASVPRDRAKALSICIGSYVFGLSVGPALQALFTPLGPKGFQIGIIFINMYTLPAFLMLFVSVISIILLCSVFTENYSGILRSNKSESSFGIVIPKFDRIAAAICIYLWFTMQSIGINIEVMASPLTIAMYNWNNQQAVLYNGIIQSISCSINVICYFALGCTCLQHCDKRPMILFGLTCFTAYHLINLPWPFYREHLDFIKIASNSSIEDTIDSGGCFQQYQWCLYTTRVPFYLYSFAATVLFGLAFPFLASPVGTLFSEVLGPRSQGIMQGIFEFFASSARFLAPLISTALFKKSGYLWPMLGQLTLLFIGIAMIFIFRKKLVPLQLKPEIGVPAKYKSGTFYRL